MSATTPDQDALREKQKRQAEELLFSGPTQRSAAKELFWGRFPADLFQSPPKLSAAEQARVDASLQELRKFCDQHLHPEVIDRQADIPRAVIDGLADLGVLGMTAPESMGGRGFSQLGYCQVLEELGGRCSATSIFVNAHHSIGMRSLLLFGTADQQRRWLPDLINGRKLAAFALTEPQAGSDAANVQTRAEPSADGSHYVLNGEKRFITNGAIADVLTVMARTPVPGRTETAITAFLVTPDMPGFSVIEPRMEKVGIRGTATAKLAFTNLVVPTANILGPLGKGLKVALTVLDFGRTTFGACCTGAAKTCLKLATEHARSRVQFGKPLGEFELVQKKIARMAAWVYAMEAMTSVTAGLIDRGLEDYMLETAMLKVYSTEALWTIVNDAFQIHGGIAYFTDQPLERMLRDARINQIGEGANEVLTSFISLVGMREPGEHLKTVWDALHRPWSGLSKLGGFLADEVQRRVLGPAVPVRSPELATFARALGNVIGDFGLAVEQALMHHREAILDRQLVQERIANAAMELFAAACVLYRRDAELQGDVELARQTDWGGPAAMLCLDQSLQRAREALRGLSSDDTGIVETATAVLRAKR